MVDTQPREVELKLAATSEAMDTLVASQLLRGHARSSLRSRQLVTTYYDTDDHRLSRRGLALRVRQAGRKFVQTLKTASDGQGAETARGEWEVELPDGNPHLTAFNDPAVLDLTGLILPGRAAADLRDPISPAGDAGRVARRQPAAGADRDRVRSWRHSRRQCRVADLRDRARAQARRAACAVRACPIAAGPGAAAPPAARQGGARVRAGHRPAAGCGARRAPSSCRRR